MSRTQTANVLARPCTKYIRWSSTNKCFQFQGKNPDETSEKKYLTYDLENKIHCIPVDILYTVKGFNDVENKAYYANEVRNLKTEPFKVMLSGKLKHEGFWSEIGLNKDLKFVISFYALLINKDTTTELVSFQLEGSALGVFIESKIKDNENNIIQFSLNPTPQKKGATTYFIPSIKRIPRSEKNDIFFQEADRVDLEVLQPYMRLYFRKEKEEQILKKAAEGQYEIPDHINRPEHLLPAGEDIALSSEDDMPF